MAIDPLPASKVCRVCQLPLPLSAFNRHQRYPDQHETICRACKNARRAARAAAPPPDVPAPDHVAEALKRLSLDIQVRASMIAGLYGLSRRYPHDPTIPGWLAILHAEQEADWQAVRRLRGQRHAAEPVEDDGYASPDIHWVHEKMGHRSA